MPVLDDFASLPERIRASADRLADLAEQTRIERATRNHLIVQAVDEAGIPRRVIAKSAGVCQMQLLRILAAASEDD